MFDAVQVNLYNDFVSLYNRQFGLTLENTHACIPDSLPPTVTIFD